MRLGKNAKEVLRDTVHRALAGPCEVKVPARNRAVAYRIFESVSPHMEEYGARPQPHVLCWVLPNGSVIRVEHGRENA